MKKLDTTGLSIIHYGRAWPHEAPPCSREMVRVLEGRDDLVFWMRGADGGDVPALRVDGVFYAPSLRMMKAIWRHVRLSKGFTNRERAQVL